MREAAKAAVRLAGVLGLIPGARLPCAGPPVAPTRNHRDSADRRSPRRPLAEKPALAADRDPGLAALAFFFLPSAAGPRISSSSGSPGYSKRLTCSCGAGTTTPTCRPCRYATCTPGAIPVHRLEVAAPKRGEGLVCDEGKPLTRKQVSRLRSLVADGHQSAEELVEVEETIPFVPVIAMAVVLTACFAGNLVPPLVRLIDWLSS